MSGTDADYTLLHHRALFNIKQEKMDIVNIAHGPDVVMLSSSPAAAAATTAATTAATASLSEEAVQVEASLESEEEDSPQPGLNQRIEDEADRCVNFSWIFTTPHLFLYGNLDLDSE